MKISELRTMIVDEFGISEFKDLVTNGHYERGAEKKELARFEKLVGLPFARVDSERTEGSGDYDGYAWQFKIGEKLYEVSGYYASHEGADLDDPTDFYRVELVERTIKVYEPVSEDEE